MRLFLIILGLVAAGAIGLNFAGDFFLREVVKEVVIEKRPDAVAAEIGQPAPDFELADLERGGVKLSAFLGSPLILTFWATWNSASADQIKIFDDYLLDNKDPLFKIITISNQEDRSAADNFIKRGGYKVRVLLDESGATGEKYGALNLPATYFIDAKGVTRDIFIGVLSEKMLVEKSEVLLK